MLQKLAVTALRMSVATWTYSAIMAIGMSMIRGTACPSVPSIQSGSVDVLTSCVLERSRTWTCVLALYV